MVEEAAAFGAVPEAWWVARRAGASIELAGALSHHGAGALLAGAMALRLRRATAEELVAAVEVCAPLAYLVGRDDGLSHEAAMAAASSDLGAFVAAASRWGQAEALAALGAGVAPADYGTYRRFAAHEQALAAHRAGASPADYALAASSGASHDEVMEALIAGADLWVYAKRRNLGAPHAEAVVAARRTR